MTFTHILIKLTLFLQSKDNIIIALSTLHNALFIFLHKGVVDVILCTHSLLGVTKFTSVYLGPFLTLSVRNGSNLQSYLFFKSKQVEQNYIIF